MTRLFIDPYNPATGRRDWSAAADHHVTPRDPVADLKAAVFADGFARGRQRPTAVAALRYVLIGFILGVVATLWSAGAFAQVPPAAEQHRRDLVRISQSTFGLGAPVSLLAAQIEQESAWKPDAVSWAGAQGLTQFMPATLRDVAARYELGPVNVFDPRDALRLQSTYMRELHRAITGAANESERWAFALSAYNGGLSRVERRRVMSAYPERCLSASCDINPGIRASAQAENRGYSRRVILVLMPRYHRAGWGGPPLHERYGV